LCSESSKWESVRDRSIFKVSSHEVSQSTIKVREKRQ
jgi:hypothetical protein